MIYILIFLLLLIPFLINHSPKGFKFKGRVYGLPIYMRIEDNGDMVIKGANYGADFLIYTSLYLYICEFVSSIIFNTEGFIIVIEEEFEDDI